MSNVLTDQDDALSGGGVLIGQVVELSDHRPKVELNGMTFLKFGYIEDSDYASELEPVAKSMRLISSIGVDSTAGTVDVTPQTNAVDHRDNVVLVNATHDTKAFFKSSDFGETWRKIGLQSDVRSSGTVTYCGHNGSGHVWVMADAQYPASYFHRSTDDGESFLRTTQGVGQSMVMFASNRVDVLMAVGGDYIPAKRVFKSTDFGDSWQRIDLPNATGGADTIAYSQTGIWITSTQNTEVFYSKDDGNTWRKANLPNGLLSRMHSIATDDNGQWLALTENSSGKCFIRSSDDGKSWTMAADFPSLQQQLGIVNIYESYGGTRRFIYRNGEWMLFTADHKGGLLITSSDLGLTWQRRNELESQLSNRYFSSVAALDNGDCVITGALNSVSKSYFGVGEFGTSNDHRYVRIK